MDAHADRTPDAATADAGPAAHDHERLELHVSRSRAFDAYVRDFGVWWHEGRASRDELHVEQHEGGAIVRSGADDDEAWGEVHEIDPGHRIRHSYRHTGEGSPTVTADFVDGDHGGAVVTLQHEAWDDGDHDALRSTWIAALRRLEGVASAV